MERQLCRRCPARIQADQCRAAACSPLRPRLLPPNLAAVAAARSALLMANVADPYCCPCARAGFAMSSGGLLLDQMSSAVAQLSGPVAVPPSMARWRLREGRRGLAGATGPFFFGL